MYGVLYTHRPIIHNMYTTINRVDTYVYPTAKLHQYYFFSPLDAIKAFEA